MEIIGDKLIPSNGKACLADIELLVKVLEKLEDNPTIVQLGAGENFTLAVFKTKPNALMYSVDPDIDAFNWETAALENSGMGDSNRVVINKSSAEFAEEYIGEDVALLIIDAEHTYEAVLNDLQIWDKHLKPEAYIFLHDYDADTAPYYYEGVEKACKEYFGKRFSWRSGWSAVWKKKGG